MHQQLANDLPPVQHVEMRECSGQEILVNLLSGHQATAENLEPLLDHLERSQ